MEQLCLGVIHVVSPVSPLSSYDDYMASSDGRLSHAPLRQTAGLAVLPLSSTRLMAAIGGFDFKLRVDVPTCGSSIIEEFFR